jgi:hypothetical protein
LAVFAPFVAVMVFWVLGSQSNMASAPIAVPVAQHILEVEDQYDAPTVHQVVRALLERAAALGVAQAHEMLADFYVTGKLSVVEPDTEALAEAYLHHPLFSRGNHGATSLQCNCATH